MAQSAPALGIADHAATTLAACRHDILAGLTAAQKRLAPKYLYDERGSQLFDEICSLPEYYATRTELGLLRANAAELAALVGPHAEVVELGAGSSLKARLLLGSLTQPASYLPVDISAAYLAAASCRGCRGLSARGRAARCSPISLGRSRCRGNSHASKRSLFFPGSTIGNLSRPHAAALLSSLAERIGGRLLLGVDACHDAPVLHPAYNDARGVTAAFNLNVLARLNRELGANFDLAGFEHDAVYDEDHTRIEMRLVSRRAQVVTIGGIAIPLSCRRVHRLGALAQIRAAGICSPGSRRRLAAQPLLARRRRAVLRLFLLRG